MIVVGRGPDSRWLWAMYSFHPETGPTFHDPHDIGKSSDPKLEYPMYMVRHDDPGKAVNISSLMVLAKGICNHLRSGRQLEQFASFRCSAGDEVGGRSQGDTKLSKLAVPGGVVVQCHPGMKAGDGSPMQRCLSQM